MSNYLQSPANSTVNGMIDSQINYGAHHQESVSMMQAAQFQKAKEIDRYGQTDQNAKSQGLSPAQVLKYYGRSLTDFEQSEILEYQSIYYFGQEAKKVNGNPHADTSNHGYDDERGDYRTVLGDHIAYRYEIVSMLGKGSFGQVVKCLDHKLGTYCAVKLIRNKKRFHHQALVEVKILQHLKRRDPNDQMNVIRVHEQFYFRNHLCITFELLSVNLYELIKQTDFNGVALGIVRKLGMQLLVSLEFLRKFKIIHCDLKPENIILTCPFRCSIKLIDFGSSCFENEKVYTYIQSRFYRSPEVILGISYSNAIDMWSLGCVLAEMFTGFPLFPGENEQEQLLCMVEVLGYPPESMIQQSTRRRVFFDSGNKLRSVSNSRGKKRYPGNKTLSQIMRYPDRRFVNFIEQCLTWEAHKRISPDKALMHPWIQGESM